MQVKTLSSQGRVSAALPAVAPNDLVRLAEFTVSLSGTAPRNHTHRAADVVDLASGLASALVSALTTSDTVTFQLLGATMQGTVRVKPAGGVLAGTEGLLIDSGVVSQPGHGHTTQDLSDFQAAFASALAAGLQASPTLDWFVSGTGLQGTVRLPVGSGLTVANGLVIDFGTGTNQAARGDHTHDELHPEVTVAASASLQINIDATQQLSAEVALQANGGLRLNSGVGLDFGTGHTQAARGDHTHAGLQSALTVAGTPTLALSLGANLLSGTVRLDGAPGPNCGQVAAGSNGLYVVLGSGSRQAAPGDHTHAAATTSAAGLMSAADKTLLNSLSPSAGGTELLVIQLDGNGQPIPTGMYTYVAMPFAGTITGWDLIGLPSGTLSLDVYRGDHISLPLTAANRVTGASPPAATSPAGVGPAFAYFISVAWSFEQDDLLGINVDACGGVRRATLGLRIRRQ